MIVVVVVVVVVVYPPSEGEEEGEEEEHEKNEKNKKKNLFEKMHTTHNFLVVKPGQDDRQDAFSDTVCISSLPRRRRRRRRHVVHLFTLVAPLRKIDSFFDASRARFSLCKCVSRDF